MPWRPPRQHNTIKSPQRLTASAQQRELKNKHATVRRAGPLRKCCKGDEGHAVLEARRPRGTTGEPGARLRGSLGPAEAESGPRNCSSAVYRSCERCPKSVSSRDAEQAAPRSSPGCDPGSQRNPGAGDAFATGRNEGDDCNRICGTKKARCGASAPSECCPRTPFSRRPRTSQGSSAVSVSFLPRWPKPPAIKSAKCQ